MPKPKRSSDDYIHLNKKITNRDHIKVINMIVEETGAEKKDVVYRILCEALKRECDKRGLTSK